MRASLPGAPFSSRHLSSVARASPLASYKRCEAACIRGMRSIPSLRPRAACSQPRRAGRRARHPEFEPPRHQGTKGESRDLSCSILAPIFFVSLCLRGPSLLCDLCASVFSVFGFIRTQAGRSRYRTRCFAGSRCALEGRRLRRRPARERGLRCLRCVYRCPHSSRCGPPRFACA